MTELFFYGFSTALIFSALMVVASKNPVHSALFLVGAFFASAALWILLEAEFLALLLVVVYVGAVMTLFLFVVMTINLETAGNRRGFMRYLPLGVLILALMVGFLIYVAGPSHFTSAAYQQAVQHAENYSNTRELGMVLYTRYAYPFELAGVLLLAGIVSAICLTARVDRTRKIQIAEQQIAVRPEERVHLIKIPAEVES